MTIVHINAGHGGKDPGALGNGMKEKDINLSVALIIGSILSQHGIDVRYTRTTDVFIYPNEIANKANKDKADVFVSIHCNAAANVNGLGVETLHYPGSKEGKKLAKSLQDSLIGAKLHNADRGLKERKDLAVLTGTKMPAALVELGFITNSKDAQLLKYKQPQMAEAVAKGILNYLGVKYIDGTGLNLIVNGTQRNIKGFIKDGISYIKIDGEDIPARLVGEALEFKVGWDETKKAVTFND